MFQKIWEIEENKYRTESVYVKLKAANGYETKNSTA